MTTSCLTCTIKTDAPSDVRYLGRTPVGVLEIGSATTRHFISALRIESQVNTCKERDECRRGYRTDDFGSRVRDGVRKLVRIFACLDVQLDRLVGLDCYGQDGSLWHRSAVTPSQVCLVTHLNLVQLCGASPDEVEPSLGVAADTKCGVHGPRQPHQGAGLFTLARWVENDFSVPVEVKQRLLAKQDRGRVLDTDVVRTTSKC